MEESDRQQFKVVRKISPIIKDTCIVNCDETHTLDASIQHIQLDDSCYYGSQYDHAVKHVAENNIMCCIVGHPKIVAKLKNINYNVSRFGWGVDTITIKESRKQGLLVMRELLQL